METEQELIQRTQAHMARERARWEGMIDSTVKRNVEDLEDIHDAVCAIRKLLQQINVDLASDRATANHTALQLKERTEKTARDVEQLHLVGIQDLKDQLAGTQEKTRNYIFGLATTVFAALLSLLVAYITH